MQPGRMSGILSSTVLILACCRIWGDIRLVHAAGIPLDRTFLSLSMAMAGLTAKFLEARGGSQQFRFPGAERLLAR